MEELRVLGFERIGELAKTPRATLVLRFGPELCRRLDPAMGCLSEPIDPVRPPELIEVRCVFAEPIGAPETITRYIVKLTVQLCEALEAKAFGARQLDLLFHRVDNCIEAIRIVTARPVRDVKRLTRLLCDKIESIGMIARGYTQAFAERTFAQLEGFGSHGFPESHAASFALIAYASSWLKCHHPDVFCAALLNAQPMGFYAPAQIVRDARDHGVDVRPVCVNASRWDCTLEPTSGEDRFAVRLGLRMVRGLANADAAAIVTARADQPYASVDDLWRRAGVPAAALVQLAEADAFRPSLKLARREALWAIKALRDEPLPLFAAASSREAKTVSEFHEPAVALRPMTAGGEVVEDYGHVGLTLRNHPVSFLRGDLHRQHSVTCAEAMQARDGRWLRTLGLMLVRQMPLSAKGIMFITIEDETGIANLVIWPKLFERQRRVVLSARMMAVHGRIQREGEVVHLIAHHLTDLSGALASVAGRYAVFPLPHGRGDELHHGGSGLDLCSPPPKGLKVRDVHIPDLHIDTIKMKTREFR